MWTYLNGGTIQPTAACVLERSTMWMLKSVRIVAAVMLDSAVRGYLGFGSDDMSLKTGVLSEREKDLKVAVRF